MFNNNNDVSDKATSMKEDMKDSYYDAKDTLLKEANEPKDMFQSLKESAIDFFSDAKDGLVSLIKGGDSTTSAPRFDDRPVSDFKESVTELKNDFRDVTRDAKREASDSLNQWKNDAKDTYNNFSRSTESDPQEFIRERREDLQTDFEPARPQYQARSILGGDILDPNEESPSAFSKFKEGMESTVDSLTSKTYSDPQKYVRELRSDLSDDAANYNEEKLTSRFEKLKSDLRDRDFPSQESKAKMNQASDYMKDTYQDMKSRASDSLDRAETKMSQASDSMKDTYQDMKSRASDSLDRASIKTEESMSRMKDSMYRAEDKAETKMNQASDYMKDKYQDMKATASNTLNKAEDSLNSTSSKLNDAASDAYKKMQGGAYTVSNKLNDGINDVLNKPLSTVTLSTDPITEERAWANKTDLTGTNIHEETFD